MHDYVWSVVLYISIYLRKVLLKVLCALVVSQKRRNTSCSIAKTITKSVTEPYLIFSTSQLNPYSSETPDSQRKKIQTFLKLFINSLLRQGALTINFAPTLVALLRSPNPRGFVSGGLRLGTCIHSFIYLSAITPSLLFTVSPLYLIPISVLQSVSDFFSHFFLSFHYI